ncbi:MAG: S8 family serine peptidase, partial [Candidatus Woesearchaeota archaeon]
MKKKAEITTIALLIVASLFVAGVAFFLDTTISGAATFDDITELSKNNKIELEFDQISTQTITLHIKKEKIENFTFTVSGKPLQGAKPENVTINLGNDSLIEGYYLSLDLEQSYQLPDLSSQLNTLLESCQQQSCEVSLAITSSKGIIVLENLILKYEYHGQDLNQTESQTQETSITSEAAPQLGDLSAVPYHLDEEAYKKIHEKGKARVIIRMKPKPVQNSVTGAAIADAEAPKSIEEKIEVQRLEADQAVEALDEKLVVSRFGLVPAPDLKIEREFETIPAVVGELSAAGLQKLMNDPDVESIELDHEVQIMLENSPNITRAINVYNKRIRYENLTGQNVSVCIVDTGIYAAHPAFADKIVAQQCYSVASNCTGGATSASDANDENGHGTHVAGIAAGGGRLPGIAPSAGIVAVRVLNASGSGVASDVIAGIDFCKNNAATYNISVVSISIGSQGFAATSPCDATSTLAKTASEAANTGLVVVAAAGNDMLDGITTPACGENVTSVVATNDLSGYASFTNKYSWATVAAPGVNINSTVPPTSSCTKPADGDCDDALYKQLSGTSMSTLMVSGVAALLAQDQKEQGKTADGFLIRRAINQSAFTVTNGTLTLPFLNAADALFKLNTENTTTVKFDSDGNIVEVFSFHGSMNFSGMGIGTNITACLIMAQNKIGLNTSRCPEYNVSAQLTLNLSGLGISNPKIQVNNFDGLGFIDCLPPKCSEASLNNNVLYFNVSNFSEFQAAQVNNAPTFNGSEYNETFLWVANANNNFVTKFNRTAALLNITVGSTPFALAVDEGFVWVANFGGNSVSKIDRTSNSISATIGSITQPSGVAIDENSVWVSTYSLQLKQIDKSTNSIVATIGIPSSSAGVFVDSEFVYTANWGDHTVSVINK